MLTIMEKASMDLDAAYRQDDDRKLDMQKADDRKRDMDKKDRNLGYGIYQDGMAQLATAEAAARDILAGGPAAIRVSFGICSIRADSFLGTVARAFGMSTNLDNAYDNASAASSRANDGYAMAR
jgi:hypothetical protein